MIEYLKGNVSTFVTFKESIHMEKKPKLMIYILFATVLLLGALLLQSNNQEHPVLLGSYQSETMPPDIFMLSFDKNGKYLTYYNSELVDEGDYKAVSDTETYIIKSDTENQLIVLLNNDEFYYYSPDGQVFLLKNLDKTPTILNP